MLSGETFAIRILSIREIIEYTNLTIVPMMPHYVRGVINLRGGVVPLIDLSVRFGNARTEVTKRTCIVVIDSPRDSDHQQVGLVVDAVNAVIEISNEEIEPPPSFGAGIRSDFIHGMGNVNNRLVILLDVVHALAADDMFLPREAANLGTELGN